MTDKSTDRSNRYSLYGDINHLSNGSKIVHNINDVFLSKLSEISDIKTDDDMYKPRRGYACGRQPSSEDVFYEKQKQQNLDNFLKNNHINNNSNSINTNPKK